LRLNVKLKIRNVPWRLRWKTWSFSPWVEYIHFGKWNEEERGRRELFQLVEGRVTRYEGRIVSDRPGKWTISTDKGRATFVEFEFHFTLLECCEASLVDFFSSCSFLHFPRDTRYMADIKRFQIEGVREKKTESRYLRNPFTFFALLLFRELFCINFISEEPQNLS